MDHLTQRSWETAIETCDLAACKALIEQSAVDMNEPVLRGPTALHHVVQYGNLDMTQLLIVAGADVHATGPHGHTPLHVAFAHDRYDHADFLLTSGASLSFVPSTATKDYLTPFQQLIYTDRLQDVRRYAVAYRLDLGQRTVDNKTLIQVASGKKDMKALLRALKTELAVADGIGSGELVAKSPRAARSSGPL